MQEDIVQKCWLKSNFTSTTIAEEQENPTTVRDELEKLHAVCDALMAEQMNYYPLITRPLSFVQDVVDYYIAVIDGFYSM